MSQPNPIFPTSSLKRLQIRSYSLKRLLELEWTFRHIAAFAPTDLLKVFDLLSFLGNHGYHEIKLKAFSCSIISRMQNC